MIFSVITQEGLKISTLNNTIYQFSDNLTFQFVRDPKFNDYTLAAYINYSDKVYSLEIKNKDTFEIDSRFLNEKKEFLLSFSLTNGEEIIHLGTINYRVKDAFGSTTSPLPGQKEVWTALVEQEVDDYFLKNYQSQLDDFNQKYEEIKKIAADGGGGTNITIDDALSETSKNPVENRIIKNELDKKAAKNEIPTNLSSLNEDETHQTVTAEEKENWNNKSDFDGNYESLKNKPEIPNAIVVDAELNETSTNAIQNSVVAKELAEKLSKNGLKTINGQSLVGSGNIELSAGDNTYELPVANNETLGGVMPIAKTAEMSQGVGVDENGRLFTFPGGSGNSKSDEWELINSFTAEEELINFTISQDSEGNEFALKKIAILSKIMPLSDLSSNAKIGVGFNLTNAENAWTNGVGRIGAGTKTDGGYVRAVSVFEIIGNKCYLINSQVSYNDSSVKDIITYSTQYDGVGALRMDMVNAKEFSSVNKITIGSYMKVIGIGSTIEIYGVRK